MKTIFSVEYGWTNEGISYRKGPVTILKPNEHCSQYQIRRVYSSPGKQDTGEINIFDRRLAFILANKLVRTIKKENRNENRRKKVV